MDVHSVWVLCLGFLFATAMWTVHAQFSPADLLLVACGSSVDVMVGTRNFLGDAKGSMKNPTLSAPGVLAFTSTPSSNLPSPKLYQQARLFPAKSTYTFQVTAGRHYIRLYFYPFSFESYTVKDSSFSVTANQYRLLKDFQPGLNWNSSKPLILKEYSLDVPTSKLELTFTPATSSYAFINAIEVVSMDTDLIPSSAVWVKESGTTTSNVHFNALETMYHVNVGGDPVTASNDSLNMYRTWESDVPYTSGISAAYNSPFSDILYTALVTKSFAPPTVYQSVRNVSILVLNSVVNLTWAFPVDMGFTYFLRLHFCILMQLKPTVNVYVQKMLAQQVSLTKLPLNTPAYFDYVVDVTASSSLQVQIGNVKSVGYYKPFLNGLEIWKLNTSSGSLSGGAEENVSGGGIQTGAIVGAAVGGLAVVVLAIVLIIFCRRKSTKLPSNSTRKPPAPSWLPLPNHGFSDTFGSKVSSISQQSGSGSYASAGPGACLARYFTFAELQEATNNFDDSLTLGVGGFGKVFKGEIDDGTKVAVKRGNPCSSQGLTEFQTEIELLSKLRHRHLVSLIGYCEEHCEMILVYDYMANGPLRGHLYGSDSPTLSWKQRLEICIGSARGLHYLHTGAAHGIIHRDVKTTNILLDENLVAKVADFGLSKTGPSLEQTHVSTAVKGSFGYLDPEYFRRQQLTEKSDVYSFGVVLVEVLCARPALDPALPRDQVNLAEWAMQHQRAGTLESIMDPKLVGECCPESVRKLGEIAEKCLQECGVDRPAMGDVLWNLEQALQLQEMASESASSVSIQSIAIGARAPAVSPIPLAMRNFALDESYSSIASDNQALISDDDDSTKNTAVFSQIMNPVGR